jgi:hypothetical protein
MMNYVQVIIITRSPILQEIRDAIPAKYFVRNTSLGLAYLARDVAMAALCGYAALHIDLTFKSPQVTENLVRLMGNQAAARVVTETTRWAAWSV